jgi:hypothetical protein
MRIAQFFIILSFSLTVFEVQAAWDVKKNKSLDISTDFSFSKYPNIQKKETYMERDTNEDVYQRIMIGTLKTPEPMAKMQYYTTHDNFSYWTLKDSFDDSARFAIKHSIEFTFDKMLPKMTIANKTFDTLSFRSVAYDRHQHNCLMYQNRGHRNSQYLKGWICLKSGEGEVQNTFKELILSLQIRDGYGSLVFNGRQFRSVKMLKKNKDVSLLNKSDNRSEFQTKAEKLKEVRDLFKQEIITKGEYENLRKQILDLN